MVNISKEATQELQAIIAEQKTPEINIRISFDGLGWGGPRLGMAFDKENQDDHKVVQEGISFVLNPMAMQAVQYNGGVDINFRKHYGFSINVSGATAC